MDGMGIIAKIVTKYRTVLFASKLHLCDHITQGLNALIPRDAERGRRQIRGSHHLTVPLISHLYSLSICCMQTLGSGLRAEFPP